MTTRPKPSLRARSTQIDASGPHATDASSAGPDPISWAVVIAGIVSAVAVLALLTLLGLLVALFTFQWNSYRAIVEALIVWGGLSAIVASFSGGIVSGLASARSRRQRLLNGAATGALFMTLLSLATAALLLRWGDLTSIGVELGYIPIPDDAPIVAPVPNDARVVPPDAVTFSVTASAWYALAVLLLLLSSSLLGAWSTVSRDQHKPPGQLDRR